LSQLRRRALTPWLLLAPGLIWLGAFYLWPALNQLYVSLQDGNIEQGFTFQWNWSTYGDAISQYDEHILRSLGYAGTATALALLVCFPLAYFIAFKARRWRNLLLLLIVLPFFTSYLVRTGAWQLILSDDGFAADTLRSVGLMDVLGQNDRLLDTRTAVIAGITYNYLPFMALPLYVSLEKIDPRLIEAATDLYASRVTAFRKVTVRLALPGIFAGCLLTFIPAVGDFVNAELLGSSRETMIGNVIQSKFLEIVDYPEAAALSFVMMAVILAVVLVSARLIGGPRQFTEGLS
jgi:spermidine/putrescine transport system permease protein